MLLGAKRKKRFNQAGRIRKGFQGKTWARPWKMAPILTGREEGEGYETHQQIWSWDWNFMIASAGNEQATTIRSGQNQFFSAWKHLPPNWGSYPSQAPLKTCSLMMVLFSSELIKSFHLVRYCFVLPFTKPQFKLFQDVDFYFLMTHAVAAWRNRLKTSNWDSEEIVN